MYGSLEGFGVTFVHKCNHDHESSCIKSIKCKCLAHTHVTHRLLSVSDNIFASQRVACLLRKVVQEIERRISTQADHLRTVSQLHCFQTIVLVFSVAFLISCSYPVASAKQSF